MSILLEGLRVVQLSGSLAAAHCANVFADLGAEVIMVESPAGAAIRSVPGFRFLGGGTKSLVLDLDVSGDAWVAFTLATQADVVLTSLRPRALERFGLD